MVETIKDRPKTLEDSRNEQQELISRINEVNNEIKFHQNRINDLEEEKTLIGEKLKTVDREALCIRYGIPIEVSHKS
jgi:predicted nuclease with TOPRIM domain